MQNLIHLIRDLNQNHSPILFVMEGDGKGSEDIVRGWVEKYWGDGRLQGLTVRIAKGRRKIRCGKVLLDFNSYELAPAWRMEIGADKFDSPFIKVNQDMETSIPGLFAAGDVTSGGYNSFSRAVSQGMAAGLSAYRYLFHKKFGTHPHLFAYRPTDFTIPSGFEELPPLDEGLLPKSLVDGKEIEASLGRKRVGLSESLNGKLSIGEIARKKKLNPEELIKILKRLLERKMITFHVEVKE